MFVGLRENISRIINLEDDEFQLFTELLKIVKYKKKEFLLREGDVCRFVYFIQSGCIRYYHNVEGKQNTGQFFFENSWYTDMESLITGKPSLLNIDTLENSEVFQLHKNDLEKLYDSIPKFERFGRLMAERAFIGLRGRTEMIVNQSPEERYLNLVKQRPKVIERIPQHYIASYLGIEPQSLSRIRKRILTAD